MKDPYTNPDVKVLYRRIKETELTYPEDHPERKKIKKQRFDLINKYPKLKEEK